MIVTVSPLAAVALSATPFTTVTVNSCGALALYVAVTLTAMAVSRIANRKKDFCGGPERLPAVGRGGPAVRPACGWSVAAAPRRRTRANACEGVPAAHHAKARRFRHTSRRHFLEKDLFYFLFNIDIVYYLLIFFVLKAPFFLFGI